MFGSALEELVFQAFEVGYKAGYRDALERVRRKCQDMSPGDEEILKAFRRKE